MNCFPAKIKLVESIEIALLKNSCTAISDLEILDRLNSKRRFSYAAETSHPLRQEILGSHPLMGDSEDFITVDLGHPIEDNGVDLPAIDHHIIHRKSEFDFHISLPSLVCASHFSL